MIQNFGRLHPLLLVILGLTLATVIRLLLTPLWGSGYTYITYFPVIALVAAMAGLAYAALATGAAAVLSVLLFLDSLSDNSKIISLLTFLVVNLVVITFMHQIQREKSQVDHALRESEAAIRASEARLNLAQSAANVGTFDWDLAAQKGVWSPELERIWGLPAGGFDGTYEGWKHQVYPDDLALAEAAVHDSLEDPATPREFEYRIVRPDGTIRWIYSKAKILSDDANRPVRMVGVNLDITDRKEAQLRLVRFAEELERQVATRTQELMSSQARLRALAAELSLTQQRERKRLATELHDHLQQILVVGRLKMGQGKRLAQSVPACAKVFKETDELLLNALAYTRTLVAELSPPVLQDHGLAAGLQWLGEYMKKLNATVTVDVPEDMQFRLSDDQEVLLFQSVRELLINSVKYSGTGQATVAMAQDGEVLRITVKDEGMGFEATRSVESSIGDLSAKFGLFSIKERMQALGGSFEIQSTPGKGTIGTLTLLLATPRRHDKIVEGDDDRFAQKKRTSRHAVALRRPQAERPIRVLLVDDHVMVRQGLRTVLDAYPDIDIVGEGVNGEEAVALTEKLRPTVVVMDVSMPGMNGVDATAKIKSRFPDIIVIGLSVNTGHEHEQVMIKAGASCLMNKEAAVEDLHTAIQKMTQVHT